MTTATRTDVHRPSAPEFDPADYVCHGVFDFARNADDWVGPGPAFMVNLLMKEHGTSFSGAPHGSGQCSHCGAYFRYGALMHHGPSNTLMYVGETCLDNRFDLTKGEFQALRKASALNRERMAKVERTAALVAEQPVLAWASYAANLEAGSPGVDLGWECSTLNDLWFKADKYGDPSEKQVAFVGRLVTKVTEKVLAHAEREAKKAVLVEAGVECPTGRVVVEGEVVSVRTEQQTFGYSTTTVTKMLVVTEAGWKVWGTMPASLADAGAEKGSKVRFTATVKPSGDDPLFGFASRPTKGSVL